MRIITRPGSCALSSPINDVLVIPTCWLFPCWLFPCCFDCGRVRGAVCCPCPASAGAQLC
jgi:hypothetical protein